MAREIVFAGRKIQVAIETDIAPDGTPVRREVILHPGAVAVLPLVDEDHVCLIRNRRVAVGETLLEIPAGTLEPPEPPEETAVRELAEETGYRAARWRKLREFYPSPGILSERMYLFVASELTPGPMRLEKDEELVPQVVPWEQALVWALDGTIQDAKTLVALLLWDRLRKPGEPGA
ncbi:MAG: NUDIX hydrolase [Gemmataceae bacterium]|nr:NUDIX hydrolase [Gemmataceae bacterium]